MDRFTAYDIYDLRIHLDNYEHRRYFHIFKDNVYVSLKLVRVLLVKLRGILLGHVALSVLTPTE